MNRLVVAGVVAVVALSVVVYAFAAGGDSDDRQAAAPSPTLPATVMPSATPATVPASPSATPLPTRSPDTPTSASPVPPSAPQPTPDTSPPPLPADKHTEPAPIDGLDIIVLESFPPQYVAQIKAGLPSGCAMQYSHDVSRSGNVITITVLNSLPNNAVCTAIYGMYDLNLNLGSDFVSGQTYSVKVNDKQTTFTAQ